MRMSRSSENTEVQCETSISHGSAARYVLHGPLDVSTSPIPSFFSDGSERASVEDKWRLIDELWSNLAGEVESAGADEGTLSLLNRRFEEYVQDPTQA